MSKKTTFFKIICVVALLCGGVIAGKGMVSGGWLSSLFSPARAEDVNFSIYGAEKQDPKLPDPKLSLASFGKPTMLVLWTVGCMPCFDELRVLNELAPEVRIRGAEVASVLLSSNWGNAVSFLTHMSRREGANQAKNWHDIFPHLPSYYDFEGKVSSHFGVQRVPLVIFLDASGREIERYEGFKKWDDSENAKILSKHLNIDLSVPVPATPENVTPPAA